MTDAPDLLGQPPVGALTDGEVAALIAWAQRFAAHSVAAERERCARLADEYATWGGSNFHAWFTKLAAAIRA